MKKFICLIWAVLTLLFISCNQNEKQLYVFTSFHEPATDGLRFLYSEDGMHWDSLPGTWLKPEIGKQRIMRDPSIVATPNGVFHLVWTTSWRGDLGFGYAHSTDLVNWSEEKFIPVMKHDTTTANVWAPELFYDDCNNELMIVWASCIPGKFERGIEDENNNHRLYYTKTKDFTTFTPTKLLFDPGFSVIDAVITKRAEKDYVMVQKDNTRPNRNLKISFAQQPEGPWSPASQAFTESFVEGPTVVQVDTNYLIYFDVYQKKIYGAMRTTDFVNFTDITNEISVPKDHKHGTIFRAPESIIEAMKKIAY